MSSLLRMFLIIGIFGYFVCILYFLRCQALNLKYTLLWIFTGVIMLFVSIFPATMDWVSQSLGIASAVNAVFALELFFQMIILLSITSIVSNHNQRNKRVAQEICLINKRIDNVQDKY